MAKTVTAEVVYDSELGVRLNYQQAPLEVIEMMLTVSLSNVRRELLARRLGAAPPPGAIVGARRIPDNGGR